MLVPDVHAQRFEGGIKLGAASTTFDGDLAAGSTVWNRRSGFAAGASLGLNMRYGFSPAIELTYVRMGATSPVVYLDIPATLRSDLTYLTGSLLLQYRLYTSRYVYPRIFAGPTYSYTASALITIAARDGLGIITEQDDSVEGTDHGFTVGGALDVEIGGEVLTLEVRYLIGQRDITKPNPDLGESELYNRGILILVGLLF